MWAFRYYFIINLKIRNLSSDIFTGHRSIDSQLEFLSKYFYLQIESSVFGRSGCRGSNVIILLTYPDIPAYCLFIQMSPQNSSLFLLIQETLSLIDGKTTKDCRYCYAVFVVSSSLGVGLFSDTIWTRRGQRLETGTC